MMSLLLNGKVMHKDVHDLMATNKDVNMAGMLCAASPLLNFWVLCCAAHQFTKLETALQLG